MAACFTNFSLKCLFPLVSVENLKKEVTFKSKLHLLFKNRDRHSTSLNFYVSASRTSMALYSEP